MTQNISGSGPRYKKCPKSQAHKLTTCGNIYLVLCIRPPISFNCLCNVVINTVWLTVTVHCLHSYNWCIEKFTHWLTDMGPWDEKVLWYAVFHAKLVYIMHSLGTFLMYCWNDTFININHLVKPINAELKANMNPKLVLMGVLFCVCGCNSQSTNLESPQVRNLEIFWHLLQRTQYPCLQSKCELNPNRCKATHWTHPCGSQRGCHCCSPALCLPLTGSQACVDVSEAQGDLLRNVNVLNLWLTNGCRTQGSWKDKVDWGRGVGGGERVWSSAACWAWF